MAVRAHVRGARRAAPAAGRRRGAAAGRGGPAAGRRLGALAGGAAQRVPVLLLLRQEAVAAGAGRTRGESLLEQQDRFYAAVRARPGDALAEWRRARQERDASYMAEARDSADAGERDAADLEAGGYEGVALALMAAIARGEPATMILNVRNGAAVPGLPDDAVVEIPCAVDGSGVRPLATSPLPGRFLGLMQQVKAMEQTTIEAALTGSSGLAAAAFALHPLVDSVTTAHRLLDGYRARIPELAAVLPG
ncbi:hypothetical protein ACFQYP_26070 [Nonomuraea antimicrobica]